MSGEVEAILKERGSSWGDAVETHERIALAWTAILGDRKVTAREVALCMVALKGVRAAINPTNFDSSLDGKAYLTIFERIVTSERKEEIECLRSKLSG